MAGRILYAHLVPKMVKMFNNGNSVSDISRTLEIDHQTIKGYLIKQGLISTGYNRAMEGKITIADAEELRLTLKKGDYICCQVEKVDVNTEWAFIQKKIKAPITNIFPRGVTVDSGEKGKRYRFITYKDILLAGQQKGA